MKINIDRARAGSIWDIALEVWDTYDAQTGINEGMADAVAAVMAEQVIERYQGHIAAALRRAGISIADDEVITGDVLRRIISERAGVEIVALTPSGVSAAFDGVMSGQLRDALGVDIRSVQSLDGLKQVLIDAAVNAVKSGRATKLISRAIIAKIRQRKAWKAGGVEIADRRKILNRWYQKKYRRTHKAVWRDIGDV